MDYEVYVGSVGASAVALVAAATSQARVAVFDARVNYGDLDLSQEVDASALLARLDRAAGDVCSRIKAPVREAIERAIDEINHPMLRAVSAARELA